ncbi:MAG: (4Fe-4S)-binding protein [Gaiellaceae bacterium]
MSQTRAGTTRDSLKREYATDEIVVEWEPRLCFHSRNCVRSLPQVFDESRRPWVAVDAATADEIEAAVALCPSGALRTRRPRAHEPGRPNETRVCASSNGPLLVSGGVRVVDADGNVLFEGERAALCRCGGSANKPFCDGTHKTNGFSA